MTFYADKMKFYIFITMTLTPDKLHLPKLDVPCLSLASRFSHHYVAKMKLHVYIAMVTSPKICCVVSKVYTRPHKVDFTTDIFYWRHLQCWICCLLRESDV